MSLRSRIGWGIVVTMLGCPLSCGGTIGMMLGEKPMPNGRIGQEPWQAPLGLGFGVAAIVSLWLCASLLRALWRPVPEAATLTRLAGVYPLGAGATMIVAGVMRIGEGIKGEGVLACLAALFPLLLGGVLILTKPSDERSG